MHLHFQSLPLTPPVLLRCSRGMPQAGTLLFVGPRVLRYCIACASALTCVRQFSWRLWHPFLLAVCLRSCNRRFVTPALPQAPSSAVLPSLTGVPLYSTTRWVSSLRSCH